MIEIRPAALDDIPGIVEIEAGEEGPWGDPDSCYSWTKKRLDRGFTIRIAFLNGAPAGHAEWIQSDEPGDRAFYLGVLQVKRSLQHRGVGRAMMAEGEAEARRRGCGRVTLIPDMDTGADIFYEKLGYRRARTLLEAKIASQPGANFEWVDAIPQAVVSEKRFVAGLIQTASRHMWELAEHPPSPRNVRRAAIPGGYVALMWFEGRMPYALAWGDFGLETARATGAAMAHALDLACFGLVFDAATGPSLAAAEHFQFEMEKLL